MSDRANITIVRLGNPVTHEFMSGDGVLGDGRVQLAEGRRASNVSFTVADPRFELANSLPLPRRGTQTEIDVWFGPGPAPRKIFSGYVTDLNPEESSGSPGSISITGQDKADGMRQVERSANATDTSAAALIKRTAEGAGLTVDLSDADDRLDQITFRSILWHSETDWDVLNRQLLPYGHRARVRDDRLVVSALGSADGTKVLEARRGRDVVSASFKVQQFRRSTTTNVFSREGLEVYDEVLAKDEAVARAVRLERTGLSLDSIDTPEIDSQVREQAMEAQARARKVFTCDLTLNRAYPELDVDWQVLLRGYGDRWSGIYNIEQVRHRFQDGRTILSLFNGGSE